MARVLVGVGVCIAAALTLYRNLRGDHYGFDYRGIWQAGRDMIHGRDPYPAPDARALLAAGHPYVLPPVLGLAGGPLSLLSFPVAATIWSCLGTAALAAALALLSVRDARIYVLVLFSFPFMASLTLGQPDGLFALLLAIGWRYRDAWPGALAAGCLIAAKLLFWPLVIWHVTRGRLRQATGACAGALGLLMAGWAAIGFAGLDGYRHLLAADARAFQIRSHSIVALALRLGLSAGVGFALAVAFTSAVVLGLLRTAADRDEAGFAAAVVASLLFSPLLWTHYVVLLFVPLAIAHRRLSFAWLITGAFWLSPTEPPASAGQVALVLALVVGLATAAARPHLGVAAPPEPAEIVPTPRVPSLRPPL